VNVCAVLLAAGGGRRMGRPKAFLPYQGELLVERAIRVLDEGGCSPVVVVLGAAAEQAPPLPDALVVVNPDWASGMASSLRVGLAYAKGEAAVIGLVDQPYLTAAAVRRLVAAPRPGGAAVATYGGQPRNPVVLDAPVWHEVAAAATGDAGARDWLRAHPDRVTEVACDDVADPTDLDTPADLAAAAAASALPLPDRT
jgi:CTP:molybdopterin cytidylyltransferase MocA